MLPLSFFGLGFAAKNNNVAFFLLGFMTRMTPYTRVVWVVFFQKGRSWGCKFYEEIRSKHCKLRCFISFLLFLFFFLALQGTLACHSSLACCATSLCASASLSFVSWSPWKNLHENSWNPKQHRYLTPKRKIKHEIFEVLYLLYLL